MDDGYTLSSFIEPDGPTLVEEVDEQLRRFTSSVRVRSPRDGDPRWLIRVGDDATSVLCDALTLLATLTDLPAETPVGSFDEASPGSLWAVLRQASNEEFALAEREGFPYPAALATP